MTTHEKHLAHGVLAGWLAGWSVSWLVGWLLKTGMHNVNSISLKKYHTLS